MKSMCLQSCQCVFCREQTKRLSVVSRDSVTPPLQQIMLKLVDAFPLLCGFMVLLCSVHGAPKYL